MRDGGEKRFPMEDHTAEVRGAGWDPRWASAWNDCPLGGSHGACGRGQKSIMESLGFHVYTIESPFTFHKCHNKSTKVTLFQKLHPGKSPWQQS